MDVETNPGPPTHHHECSRCHQTFDRIGRYQRHMNTQEVVDCSVCQRPFCNHNRMLQHYRTEHSFTTTPAPNQPQQQPTPQSNPNHPIYPQTGMENEAGYRETVSMNHHHIKNFTKNRKYIKIVNERITPDFSFNNLRDRLFSLFSIEKNVYRLNLGFGLMLHNQVLQEYKYFYVSSNSYIFDRAPRISRRDDVNHVFDRILNIDLDHFFNLSRPGSGWRVVGVPNVQITIIRYKSTPIGGATTLPAHVKNKRCIIGLTHNEKTGEQYTDNLCFFRCLGLFKNVPRGGLENPVKAYKKKLETFLGRVLDDGVDIEILAEAEVCYKIGINVYSLNEDGTCKVIRVSNVDYPPCYLNLYDGHFSYIDNFKIYSKKYECSKCGCILNRDNNHRRHFRNCRTEVKEFYRAGKYKNRPTVFELLETLGIKVAEDKRYDGNFIVYDFEALLKKVNQNVLGRNHVQEHVPATVSMLSNLPNHDNPIHLVSDGNTQTFIDTFVTELLKLQQVHEECQNEKYADEIIELERLCMKAEADLVGIGRSVQSDSQMDTTPQNRGVDDDDDDD